MAWSNVIQLKYVCTASRFDNPVCETSAVTRNKTPIPLTTTVGQWTHPRSEGCRRQGSMRQSWFLALVEPSVYFDRRCLGMFGVASWSRTSLGDRSTRATAKSTEFVWVRASLPEYFFKCADRPVAFRQLVYITVS